MFIPAWLIKERRDRLSRIDLAATEFRRKNRIEVRDAPEYSSSGYRHCMTLFFSQLQKETQDVGKCISVAPLIIAGLLLGTAGVEAQQEATAQLSVVRQSLDDAWWTGPMLAPSAATLPRGHFLVEPYLYDVIAPHSNGFGSLTYINYGLIDRLTVGVIPVAGFNKVSGGPSSSGVGMGDITMQAQYRLTKFHEGSRIPTISVAVQETFPSGRYDRLGDRPSDAFGGGAYTTTLALYSQTYFWLPNRRILRMRFNLSQALSNNVDIQDVSVYGTAAGFRGHAKPGSPFFGNAYWEYSLTRRWVPALDATYRHEGGTHVIGHNILDLNNAQTPSSIRLNSGSSESFGLAPAIEYNWTANLGMLLGVRVIAGRNTTSTVTPVLAINFVH